MTSSIASVSHDELDRVYLLSASSVESASLESVCASVRNSYCDILVELQVCSEYDEFTPTAFLHGLPLGRSFTGSASASSLYTATRSLLRLPTRAPPTRSFFASSAARASHRRSSFPATPSPPRHTLAAPLAPLATPPHSRHPDASAATITVTYYQKTIMHSNNDPIAFIDLLITESSTQPRPPLWPSTIPQSLAGATLTALKRWMKHRTMYDIAVCAEVRQRAMLRRRNASTPHKTTAGCSYVLFDGVIELLHDLGRLKDTYDRDLASFARHGDAGDVLLNWSTPVRAVDATGMPRGGWIGARLCRGVHVAILALRHA
ncbi:hypothetical protein BD626DRAFT_576714 [Schizophyllum amplum]|uniref:Uncharacterized protein n=1 Tax=Schizophyllum amplum TaxID=97359 RepID=A0A550BT48_9AGAR|nr:hypothetical protein BD626DRAFT_576714 [Auriculariopsis ampla]